MSCCRWLALLAFLSCYCCDLNSAGSHSSLNRKFRQANETKEVCQIPASLQGIWYGEQKDSVTITETQFSGKGTCVSGRSHYFLFQLTTGQKTCWRCVSFFQHHYNIIGYKETKCRYQLPAEQKCQMDMFEGDAVMVTLFRADSQSQQCPLQGSYKFHYTDYRGTCKSRSSVGHSCARTSQLQHQFEACPEALQSESKTENLECIGSWTANNNKYFAARLSVTPSTTAEFRCFVYQLDQKSGIIGQSEDASCRELSDINSVPIRIQLTYDNRPHRHACSFKQSLIENPETQQKRQWESLENDLLHSFTDDLWITKDQMSQNISVRQCVTHKKEAGGHLIEYVTYTTDQCTNGFQCVRVYHRTKQIVEVRIGHITNSFNDACSLENISSDETSPYETLIATDSEFKPCPNHHRYKIHTCDQDDSTLSFGCDNHNHFVIDYKCNKRHRGTHYCLGHWKDNSAEYLILRDVLTEQKSCFVYSRHSHSLMLSGSHGESCKPGVIPGVNSHLVFNASQSGFCSPTASAFSSNFSPNLGRNLAMTLTMLMSWRLSLGRGI